MTIKSINDFADAWGIEVKHLKKSIYKGTSCGAWIEWDDKRISIGSIVEGSDAEFSRTFEFPCKLEEIENWFEELEILCDDAWHEANDEWEEDDYV